MAVEVAFQCSVHGDNAETANQLWRVCQFRWTECQVLREEVHIVIDMLYALVGTGHCCARSLRDKTFLNEIDNSILYYLRENLQLLKTRKILDEDRRP